MKLKSIIFTTESFETIEFDGEWIGDIILKDFSTSFERIGTEITKIDIINTAAIEIFSGGDGPREKVFRSSGYKTKFQRLLAFNDIAKIDFTLDNKSYSYYTCWSGNSKNENGEENKYQTTYLSSLGNLYIAISSKGKEEFFNKELINDEDYMKTCYEFYRDSL